MNEKLEPTLVIEEVRKCLELQQDPQTLISRFTEEEIADALWILQYQDSFVEQPEDFEMKK